MPRDVAYITQDDAMYQGQTVREVLLFYAALRLPAKMPHASRVELVEHIIQDLGLESAQNTLVGFVPLNYLRTIRTDVKRGISGGERKRLSIGCELLGKPSAIFLDEPTSGLDSFNSLAVMTILDTLASQVHLAHITSTITITR